MTMNKTLSIQVRLSGWPEARCRRRVRRIPWLARGRIVQVAVPKKTNFPTVTIQALTDREEARGT